MVQKIPSRSTRPPSARRHRQSYNGAVGWCLEICGACSPRWIPLASPPSTFASAAQTDQQPAARKLRQFLNPLSEQADQANGSNGGRATQNVRRTQWISQTRSPLQKACNVMNSAESSPSFSTSASPQQAEAPWETVSFRKMCVLCCPLLD